MEAEAALELDLELPHPLTLEEKKKLEEELRNVIRRHLPTGRFQLVLTAQVDRLILRVLMPKGS